MSMIDIDRARFNKSGKEFILVFDDYGSDFFVFEGSQDNVELVKQLAKMASYEVAGGTEYLCELFEHIRETESSVYVDGEYVAFEEFSEVFSRNREEEG